MIAFLWLYHMLIFMSNARKYTNLGHSRFVKSSNYDSLCSCWYQVSMERVLNAFWDQRDKRDDNCAVQFKQFQLYLSFQFGLLHFKASGVHCLYVNFQMQQHGGRKSKSVCYFYRIAFLGAWQKIRFCFSITFYRSVVKESIILKSLLWQETQIFEWQHLNCVS